MKHLKSLEDIGKWYGGGTPSKANSSFWIDGTIPWLSPKDFSENEVNIENADRITENAIEKSSTRLLPSKSILFVTRSGILRRYVPIALIEKESTINQDVKALIVNDKIAIAEYVFQMCVASKERILWD